METPTQRRALQFSQAPSIPARVEGHAHEAPHSTAISFNAESMSWHNFAELVRYCARDLKERGVRQGDRVGMLLTNRPEFLVLTSATAAIGAISVPINFRLAAGEVAYIIDNVTPRVLYVEEPTAELAETAATMASSTFDTVDCDTANLLDFNAYSAGPLDDSELFIPTDSDDFAIIHTSGTTGHPKGAVISHGSISTCAGKVANKWGLRRGGGVVMLAPPLFHIGTFLASHAGLVGGSTSLVIPSAGFDPAQTLDTMKRFAVTAAFMVPQQWQMLCEEIERVGGEGLALTHANWGGAPASEKLLERMKTNMPGTEVKASFGQTETTGYGVSLDFEDSLRKIGSVGTPENDMAVRVVDPNMNDVSVGDVGEIVYRGVGVMSRYWNDEKATDEAFFGGWFHSGDLVKRDEDGFIYVVDRLKDMIISGGENIYCAEIENVLAWHPDVADVSIVGRPDEKWGEVPVAFIVPRDGNNPPDLASVREYLADRLASYKHPKDVRIVEAFPRSGIGKIQKTVLRETVKAS